MKGRTLLIGLVALCATQAMAQFGAPVPEETKSLAYLVGHWEGEAKFSFMGEESTGKASFDATMLLDGRYLRADHAYSGEAVGNMKGMQMLGYDSAKSQWTSWWFDSSEFGTMEMRGTAESDTTTMVSAPMSMAGMDNVVMKATMKRVSDTKMEFRLFMKQGEDWAPMMSVNYVKS